MFNIFGLCVPIRNSTILPLLISFSTKTSIKRTAIAPFHFPKQQKYHFCFCFQDSAMPPSSKAKIVAEYAKSNRSSCKKCSQVISAKALRLGLVTRDSRGFGMTKWHHLGCFSETIESTEAIGGFASLQMHDQEALKKLVSELKNSVTEVSNASKDAIKGSTTSNLKRTFENVQEVVLEERNLKTKLANEEGELEIAFSLSDIKETYKDATLLPKWKAFQTLIFLERDDGLQDSNKIAAFDFDGCLAKTSVKRVGADAWSLMYPSIPDKLQSLYNDGYKLNKRQTAVDSKLGRVNNFIKCVKVPMQVFVACGYSYDRVEDPFRKPKPGMWWIMEKHFNSGISIDMDKSFYVGDAAGRIDDHSDADIKFAQAIGLKFFVPEDYFGA
ncbi:polynucleotide 3'-phosphatase ZDP isoform X3 [Manihot esculenta]|uniref:Uncharacterized protein n=1 Tax=Manihot esculenta TaxID=3983 RepID=A0ACB7GA90_MANES|nr:polynucleotide 3'-phosphatase ZDP isoform X3 [Manihot esculenta]KAG8637189.1 hypothetical protein MANES_15G094900v8 [Manihot esculenta]